MGDPVIDFVAAIFAFVAFVVMVGKLSGSSPYDQIGAGGMSLPGDDEDAIDSRWQTDAERESEIRQVLQARSERLVRMGQSPLDVDAEVARALDQLGQPSAPDPRPAREV